MPSSFSGFNNGDVIHAEQVSEMHEPIRNLERGASFYGGTSGGSSTAYTVALSPAPDSPYQDGMMVNFKVHIANGAGSPDVTLDVNSLAAKPILKNGGSSLSASDLAAGQVVSVVYDSASSGAFHLIGKF